MKNFQFNNFSSQDFNLGIVDVKIGSPKPNIIKIDIPYHNGSYDYSTAATGGLMTYSNRNIVIDVNYLSENKVDMYKLYNKISTWLLGNSSNLMFNYMPNGTFKGRCVQISELSSFISYGKLTITFDCEPFFYEGKFGDYMWDTFNFNEDNADIATYIINTNDKLNLYNPGINVRPTITVDSKTIILIGETHFTLEVGSNNLFGLNLYNGYNEIVIEDTTVNTNLTIDFEKNLI